MSVPIAPIAVDALLLRAQMPELVLRPGVSVVARVASRGEGAHGVLVLAGVPLTAELPKEVASGETLRLTVSEVTAERVTLRLEQPPPPLANALAAAPPPAPPEGPRVTVTDRPRREGSGEEEVSSVVLAFTSPELGRLDLRMEVSAAGVRASVAAPAGESYEVAQAAAEALRTGLEARTGLAAGVRVVARPDPVDLYA